jgi:hypothetical protein
MRLRTAQAICEREFYIVILESSHPLCKHDGVAARLGFE